MRTFPRRTPGGFPSSARNFVGGFGNPRTDGTQVFRPVPSIRCDFFGKSCRMPQRASLRISIWFLTCFPKIRLCPFSKTTSGVFSCLSLPMNFIPSRHRTTVSCCSGNVPNLCGRTCFSFFRNRRLAKKFFPSTRFLAYCSSRSSERYTQRKIVRPSLRACGSGSSERYTQRKIVRPGLRACGSGSSGDFLNGPVSGRTYVCALGGQVTPRKKMRPSNRTSSGSMSSSSLPPAPPRSSQGNRLA